MSLTLGDGFRFPEVSPADPLPDPNDVRTALLLEALANLRDSLNSLPAPQVTIDAPDLSAIVNAVNSLRPGVVDPDEIGRAVANALVPMPRGVESSDWQDRLIAALDKLDSRMKGLGRSGGGGPASLPPTLSTAPAADTGQTALPVRIISQLGAGTGGASATSVTINDPTVTSQKLAIDASGRVTVVQSGPVAVTGTFWQATQPVSIATMPSTPVTGTFFQATQPVSLATNTPDVVDRAARLLGHVTVDNASLPVTGTFFQATQPVSAANLPLPSGAAQDGIDISAPTAMPAGGAGIRGWLSAIWTKLNGSLAVTGTFWQATQPVSGTFFQATQPVSLATNTPTLAAGTNTVGNLNEIRAATTYATIVSSAISLGATLTLPAAGAGLFHYITSIEITNYTGIARTGGATPVTVTTTNITGNPAYTFATAAAIGTTDIQRPILATPLKTAVANTATTIVAPVVTGSFWRINVTYFVAA